VNVAARVRLIYCWRMYRESFCLAACRRNMDAEKAVDGAYLLIPSIRKYGAERTADRSAYDLHIAGTSFVLNPWPAAVALMANVSRVLHLCEQNTGNAISEHLHLISCDNCETG